MAYIEGAGGIGGSIMDQMKANGDSWSQAEADYAIGKISLSQKNAIQSAAHQSNIQLAQLAGLVYDSVSGTYHYPDHQQQKNASQGGSSSSSGGFNINQLGNSISFGIKNTVRRVDSAVTGQPYIPYQEDPAVLNNPAGIFSDVQSAAATIEQNQNILNAAKNSIGSNSNNSGGGMEYILLGLIALIFLRR